MPSPLEIGLLTPACRGFNAVDGGIAAYFADLAAGLSELGCTVRCIVTEPPPRQLAVSRDFANVGIIAVQAAVPPWLQHFTAWHWPLHTLAARRLSIHRIARALRLAHATRPFHCIETDSCGLLALEYLGRSARPPVVTRVATTLAQLVAYSGGRAHWHERVLQRWEKRLVRKSDMVITHTDEHRREIAREFNIDVSRVHVIPLGISLPPDEELPEPARDDSSPRLLYVGRFEHRKGIDILLGALPGALSAVPGATCQLVGRDSNDYWQTRFWKENPGLDRKRVTFAGSVDCADLRAAYRECDVFVAPSRYESFGLIFVEAMAWGKPVVGCRTGGVPEVVSDGETGLLVEPGDSDRLRVQLIRLLNDPALRMRMGVAARARVQAHFSRATLAQRSAGLYAELADQRRHAA